MDQLDYDNEFFDLDPNDLWVYNKLQISRMLGYRCGPIGVKVLKPDNYIVRPSINFLGLGFGAHFTYIQDTTDHLTPGHFWCEIFEGKHYSVDYEFGKRVRTTGSNLTGVLELADLQLSSNNYNNIGITNAIRPRDDNANFEKPIDQIISQQVINDYRQNLVRYEGKLYNLLNDPFGLNNKVWINFHSTNPPELREDVSCYIDSMTYSVKRNAYEVIMHIPNQNDDQASTFKATF